eukprot:TRINITY_DN14697_c0_g1_i1.p1 TRINITY_DN14697_c0_g1~~TRINITY_DN14697_c0_g1_i1.p1  ORF type:complete len:342 (-),score=100.24 TRINITY_DN14697_c0_g1_i1:22-1047(-)
MEASPECFDDLTLEEAKKQIDELLERVKLTDLSEFGTYLVSKAVEARQAAKPETQAPASNANSKPATSMAERKKLRQIDNIRTDIRNMVPATALAENEKNTLPHSATFDGFTLENSLHVDSFLFPDEDIIDEYCDKGLLQRDYCAKCGGRDIAPLNFLSHSISDTQAKFIFNNILPKDNKTKTLVDVGSRLGVALYYGYYFGNFNSVVGVEFNSYFTDIQNKIVKKYKMEDKVKVICNDIRKEKDLLGSADVVILNNVFDAFVETNQQLEVWQYILSAISKPGAIIVTHPSIETSLEHAGIQDKIDITTSLTPLPIDYPASLGEDDLAEVLEFYAYTVNNP